MDSFRPHLAKTFECGTKIRCRTVVGPRERITVNQGAAFWRGRHRRGGWLADWAGAQPHLGTQKGVITYELLHATPEAANECGDVDLGREVVPHAYDKGLIGLGFGM